MRLLLVEDNPDLADAIIRRMRRSGHAVDWQADGLAAASVLRYQSFDLVVLDIGLPKLDGLRVLAGQRSGAGRWLPVRQRRAPRQRGR